MATASKTFTLTVNASGGGTLPGSNQVTLVGTNTMDSLLSNPRLSGASPQAFSSHDFSYALHGAYGAGTFVPGVGTNGVYCAVDGGGDAAPVVFDGAVFSFDDFTWRLVPNSLNCPNSQIKQFVAVTNGAPYYEMTGYGVTPSGAQHYHMAVGYNGKFIRTAQGYGPSIVASPYSHTFDPVTGVYARFTSNALPYLDSQYVKEAYAFLDTTRINSSVDRVWFTSFEAAYWTRIPYIDLSTNTWSQSVSFPAPAATGYSGNYPTYIFLNDGTHKGLLIFNLNSDGTAMMPRVLDLTNDAATALGWRSITMSGSLSAFRQRTLPASYYQLHDQNINVKWDRYPSDNCYYGYDGISGNVTKITPPAYANWFSSAWTVSTITPTGSAFPGQYNGFQNGLPIANLPHYSRWFYVPGLNCFAWVAGGPRSVALWKP